MHLRHSFLEQAHGAADLFFTPDQVDVIPLVEDVACRRIWDDLRFTAGSHNGCAGLLPQSQFGKRFS